MKFLTYNGNGPFTGAYIQDDAPIGVSYIEVDDDIYLNWVNLSYQDGEIIATPPLAPAPAEVPASVTMRQARLSLLAAGLLSNVDTAIAALDEPERSQAQIEWEYAHDVQRDSNLVVLMQTALGQTDEQIDALFIAAGAL